MSPISFWMTLAFFSAMSVSYPFISACSSDERNYLLDFKGALFDPAGRLSSWQGYNCCQWRGVACDDHSGHVIRLDLKNHHHGLYDAGIKNLSGEIHASLFNLEHLQHLDLSWNDFNGTTISPQLAKLKKLTFLSFAYAGFGGEIPMEIGNLSALRHLDLSSDQFDRHPSSFIEMKSSRFVEWVRNLRSLEYLAMREVNLRTASEHWGEALRSLSNLRHIDLTLCGISGSPIPSLLNLTHLSHLRLFGNSFPFPLPTWFQNVSSLVSLDLTICDLKGSIPSSFLHRSSISHIDLADNYLEGTLAFIPHLPSSLKSLDLSLNNLEGVIPPSIANFSGLENLYLEYTALTGNIPFSIGRLSSLRQLALHSNSLTGNIPISIGRLSSLRHLDLGYNQLNGTIPDTISKLFRLETLLLFSNNFTGNVSLSLFENLTKLEALAFSGNQLTVSIASTWNPRFASLQYLNLSFCKIEGEFPAFLSAQYSLKDLDMSNNNIVGNIPTFLWDLPNLYALNLSNNKLEGPVAHIRSNSLVWVDLHSNSLQGSLPVVSFPACPYYESCYLDLSENEFNGSISAIIGDFLYISLSGNNLSGGIPDSICTERNTWSLQIMDLSKNSLTDTIPSNLGKCDILKVLNLAQNDLQGEIPEELGNLLYLYTLNLNGNHLQGIIPPSIANCTDLRVFDIGDNRIEGSIPDWIGELKELRILSLTSNNFQGMVPPHLLRLQNLQILDLSHNNLSGHLPVDLAKLHAMVNQSESNEIQHLDYGGRNLEYSDARDYIFVDEVTLWIKGHATFYPKIRKEMKSIDLSHNNLSGAIPWEMGYLKGLIALNLANNNLSGIIPESLGGMIQLESLDLSGNKLTGNIPVQFEGLYYLEYLNLSNNKLSGRVPWGKQMTTFDAASFAGNPDLHGPPLENKTLISAGDGQRDNQQDMNKEGEDGEEEDDESEVWWGVGVGLSYGVGFSLVVGVLSFAIQWRKKYFAVLDRLVIFLCEG